MDKFEEMKQTQQENSESKPIEVEIELGDMQSPHSGMIDTSSKSEPGTPIEIPVETEKEGVIPTELTASRESTSTKKKFYKKKWFWAAIAVLLIIGVFAGGSNDEKDKTEDAAVAIEEQAEEQAVDQESLATNAALAGSSDMYISDDLIVSTLNSSSDWSGTWKVVSDRHFAFYPEGDIATAFITAGTYYTQYGYLPEEMKQAFDNMIESMKQMSSSISADQLITIAV